VAPDDVQDIIIQTIAHRLLPLPRCGRDAAGQVRAMVEAVALP
jgi:MoxR-like ATPase